MAEDGSLPREIDGFLASLRGDPSLKRHFPLIEVTGLRANPVRTGVPPSASYSVVCLPAGREDRRPRKAPDRPSPSNRPDHRQGPRDLLMSSDPQPSGLSRAILKQLSHPLKLRLVLCVAMIVVWQALFFSPLSDSVSATTARIARERKRAATAREIEQLRKSLAPHRDLIGTGDDVHELIRHVMGRIRSSPLRLVDLKPEKPKDLGPFEAIGLQLNLEGGYSDIDRVPRLGRDR